MKKNDQITIHDIAKALGIDSSTVSRALNNSSRVSEKTKKRILEKAHALGYQRNSLASNLRTNKTNTIGVIVPRISRNFFSNIISGIEDAAYQEGYNVIICQSLESFDREKKIMETLLANRVDGILLSTSMETLSLDHLKPYLTHGGPIVFYDRPCNFENCSSITINDYKGSFKATEHLILNGCKDIVYFSGPETVALYQNRKKGYVDALAKHNIAYRSDYCMASNLSENDGIRLAEQMLKLPQVDGLFSSNDTAAIGAMKYLKNQGVSVPNDIAVVGFNNHPISSVIEPSLTTINQPDFIMGQLASSMLIRQIKQGDIGVSKETEILDVELIIRNSSQKI